MHVGHGGAGLYLVPELNDCLRTCHAGTGLTLAEMMDVGDHGDRRVVRKDRLLDAPELRSRLEAKLVGEHAPCLLEGLERVRLSPAAVERQHQLAPQPLPERVVRDRGTQGRDELAVLSERERHLELFLERVHT